MTEDKLRASIGRMSIYGFWLSNLDDTTGKWGQWIEGGAVKSIAIEYATARVAEATADLRHEFDLALRSEVAGSAEEDRLRAENARLREQLAALRHPIRDSAQTLYRVEVRRQLGTFNECDVDQLRDIQHRLAEIANSLASEGMETAAEMPPVAVRESAAVTAAHHIESGSVPPALRCAMCPATDLDPCQDADCLPCPARAGHRTGRTDRSEP